MLLDDFTPSPPRGDGKRILENRMSVFGGGRLNTLWELFLASLRVGSSFLRLFEMWQCLERYGGTWGEIQPE